jgi:2-oxoglutarate ferredoxin oxidoreductase subunit beta
MEVVMKDFNNGVKPTWCPGCGDFSVLTAIQKAAVELQIAPHDLAFVSGVGCSGRISGYLNTYGIQGVHGRALPLAQGMKLANDDLNVVVAGGDGDGFGIGLGHFIHTVRRNIDLTYIVMDNQIYGLTKGQTSPTSPFGFQTKTTPQGNPEIALHPLKVALMSGASFVAQAFSGNPRQIIDLIKEGMEYPGFAFINVFSPCVTFNKLFTYNFFKEKLVDTSSVSEYDSSDLAAAIKFSEQNDYLCTGLIYKSDKAKYAASVKRDKEPGLGNIAVDPKVLGELCERYR